MTEMGEGVFVPEPGNGENGEGEDNSESEKSVKIRLLLFFDGTANNRTNVEEREENSEVFQDLEGQWVPLKSYKSYLNAKTNIALLEENLDDEAPPQPFDHAIKLYVEGAGTEDREHDKRKGLAAGTGTTGIDAKVKKGIRLAVEGIREVFQNSEEDTTLEKLAIDLFGFSRGAASARYCIHQLVDEGDEPIAEQLETEGFPAEKIEINFVGLFDTVSSHGVVYSNDVADLKLDAIRRARRVIQLEASEEYRKNFSLTSIRSAGGKGQRICLPGAHADVGGGYRSGPESQVVFQGSSGGAESDRKWLLARGWYRPEELTATTFRHDSGFIEEVHAERSMVKASYSKIPLEVMADFIKEEGMSMDTKEYPRIVNLSKESEELKELQGRIRAYVSSGADSSPEHWQKPDPLLNIVRHQYLHFSAHYSGVGMKPRWRQDQRKRRYYEG